MHCSKGRSRRARPQADLMQSPSGSLELSVSHQCGPSAVRVRDITRASTISVVRTPTTIQNRFDFGMVSPALAAASAVLHRLKDDLE